MSTGAYLYGAAQLAVTLIAALTAGAVVVRRRLHPLGGAARVVAWLLIATAVIELAHLLPLAAGVLVRPLPALLAAAAAGALAAWLPAAPRAGAAADPEPVTWPSWTWLPAIVAAGAVAAASVGYVHALAYREFQVVDTLAFHLPGVASWIQRGSLWHVSQFLPYQFQGYYPDGGDVMLLAAALPWHSDFAVRFVDLPFMAMCALATYALAVELRAPRQAAATFAVVVPALPIVALSAYEGELPDAVMYATFAAGLLFGMRWARTRAREDLLLAALGLGLCFGVKWYSLSTIAVVVLVALAVELARRRPLAAIARDGAVVLAGLLALGGVWLLRNWIAGGNPFMPEPVHLAGVNVFSAPDDFFRRVSGFTIFDYVGHPGDGHIWSAYILPGFHDALGGFAYVLPAAVVLALVAVRAGQGPRDGRPYVLLAAGALVSVVYFATPYSALGVRGLPLGVLFNARYWVPALLCVAPAGAWACGRLPRPVGIALQLAVTWAVLDSLDRGFTRPDSSDIRFGALAVLLAVAVLAVARATRGRPRAAWAAGAALAVLLAALAGRHQQRVFLAQRYTDIDAALQQISRDPAVHRVALVGVWDGNGLYPTLPAFGPRLGNRVDYVGPTAGGALGQYGDAPSLEAALRRGRYDTVILGRSFIVSKPVTLFAWVAGAGYRVAAVSPRFITFTSTR
jgi:hypothetical protein